MWPELNQFKLAKRLNCGYYIYKVSSGVIFTCIRAFSCGWCAEWYSVGATCSKKLLKEWIWKHTLTKFSFFCFKYFTPDVTKCCLYKWVLYLTTSSSADRILLFCTYWKRRFLGFFLTATSSSSSSSTTYFLLVKIQTDGTDDIISRADQTRTAALLPA